ncbi:hypothetical protein PInf_003138 [Phytophthora infestans]|nr:hypothetical protein PInf_003138 [Phytophthora infestans]
MDRPISDESNNTAVATAPCPAEDSRAFAHGAAPAFLSAVTTRTLINPRQRRRAVEYHATPGSATLPESPPANFEPNPEPLPRDVAATRDFVQRREYVIRYVRDAIAAAVDR